MPTKTEKPHVPTLVSALIVVVILLVIYHLAFKKR